MCVALLCRWKLDQAEECVSTAPISLQSTVLESLIFPFGPFYPEEGGGAVAVGGGGVSAGGGRACVCQPL